MPTVVVGPSLGDGLPPMLPGVVAAILTATILSGWAARRLGTSGTVAWLLLASVGVILAVTLTPSRSAFEHGATGVVTCDLGRVGPAALEIYLRFGDPVLNILLFVPLGMFISQLDHHRRHLLLAAALLPFAIEVIQAVAVPLDRACQGGDVFDNLAGLVAGLALGTLWRRARPRP